MPTKLDITKLLLAAEPDFNQWDRSIFHRLEKKRLENKPKSSARKIKPRDLAPLSLSSKGKKVYFNSDCDLKATIRCYKKLSFFKQATAVSSLRNSLVRALSVLDSQRNQKAYGAEYWNRRLNEACPSLGLKWKEILEEWYTPTKAKDRLSAKILSILADKKDAQRMIFLIGPAGWGKSTLLHKIYAEFLNRAPESLILLPGNQLRDLSEKEIFGRIEHLYRLDTKLNKETTSKLILVLDGLDEAIARLDLNDALRDLIDIRGHFRGLVISASESLYHGPLIGREISGVATGTVSLWDNATERNNLREEFINKAKRLRPEIGNMNKILDLDGLSPRTIVLASQVFNDSTTTEPNAASDTRTKTHNKRRRFSENSAALKLNPAHIMKKVVNRLINETLHKGGEYESQYKIATIRLGLRQLAAHCAFSRGNENLPANIKQLISQKSVLGQFLIHTTDSNLDETPRVAFSEDHVKNYLASEALVAAVIQNDVEFIMNFYGPRYWHPNELADFKLASFRLQGPEFWIAASKHLPATYSKLKKKLNKTDTKSYLGMMGILDDLSCVVFLNNKLWLMESPKPENEIHARMLLGIEATTLIKKFLYEQCSKGYPFRMTAALSFEFLRQEEEASPLQACIRDLSSRNRQYNTAIGFYQARYSDIPPSKPEGTAILLKRIQSHLGKPGYRAMIGWDLFNIVKIMDNVKRHKSELSASAVIALVAIKKLLNIIDGNKKWWGELLSEAKKKTSAVYPA